MTARSTAPPRIDTTHLNNQTDALVVTELSLERLTRIVSEGTCMVLTQSRWQRLWSHLAAHSAELVAVPIVAWATLHLTHHALREPFSLGTLVTSAVLPPVAMAIYELVMNSGTTHLPSAEFRWDEDGFAYGTFGDVVCVRWDDYRGYRRPWTPMGNIRIRSATHRDIRFPYLTFSVEQREALFAELDRRKLQLGRSRQSRIAS